MPSNAGYMLFLRDFALIPEAALPDTSAYIWFAYQAALDVCNRDLQGFAGYQYDWAIYNLATDNLINWCPDQPGQTYFTDARKAFGLAGVLVAGLVQSTSDEGTSTTLTTADFLKTLGMQDLINLRTPFGREYLAYAARSGSLWGVS